MESSPATDALFAGVLCAVFLGLHAGLAAPFGMLPHTGRLAAGFLVTGVVPLLGALAVGLAVGLFRRLGGSRDDDLHLVLGVVVSAACALGWAVFVALDVREMVGALPGWAAALTYAAGLVAAWLGFVLVSVSWSGTLFRITTLAVSVLGYLVAVAWPAGLLG